MRRAAFRVAGICLALGLLWSVPLAPAAQAPTPPPNIPPPVPPQEPLPDAPPPPPAVPVAPAPGPPTCGLLAADGSSFETTHFQSKTKHNEASLKCSDKQPSSVPRQKGFITLNFANTGSQCVVEFAGPTRDWTLTINPGGHVKLTCTAQLPF